MTIISCESLSFLIQRIRDIHLQVVMSSAFRSRKAQSARRPLPEATFTLHYTRELTIERNCPMIRRPFLVYFEELPNI